MVRRASRKFDLNELEEKIQEEWEHNNTYEKTKETLKGGKNTTFSMDRLMQAEQFA